jgi:hypothetical protein
MKVLIALFLFVAPFVVAQENTILARPDSARGRFTTGEHELLIDVPAMAEHHGLDRPSEYICIWPDETPHVVVMKRGESKVRYYDDETVPVGSDPDPPGCEEFVWAGSTEKSVRLYLCKAEVPGR